MAGFKWSLDWDTNPIKKGGQVAADAIDDAADTFEDFARTADKSTDKAGDAIGDNLGDGAKEGRNALDKLTADMRSVADAANASSKNAGDDIGGNIKRGAKEADEGVDALKDNTAANAKEIGASFSDVGSIIDGVQGLAAEALEGFGPMGLAAGVGVAAGIGLISSGIQKADEKVQELHDDAVDLASSLRDAGTDGAQIASLLGERFEEFGAKIATGGSAVSRFFGAKLATNVDLIVDLLGEGVVNAEDLNKAFKSSTAEDRIAGMRDIMEKAQKVADHLNLEVVQLTPAQHDLAVASEKVAGAMKGQIAVEEQANELNKALAASAGVTVSQYEAQQKALEDAAASQESFLSAVAATGDASDIFNAALEKNTTAAQQWAEDQAAATEDTTDSWEDFATDVTVSLDDVLAELAARVATERTFEANLKKLGEMGYGSLADSLRAGGPEANGAVTAALAAGTDAQVQRFAQDQGYLTGQTLTKGAGAGVVAGQSNLQETVNGVVTGMSVPHLTIKSDFDNADAERQINNTLSKTRYVDLIARVGTMKAV